MKTWLNATYEDVIVETAPGVAVPNDDMINKLNWTSYLAHIGELISMDSNQYELIVKEHFETLLLCIHGEKTRAMTGKYPSSEEVDAYMDSLSTKETIRHLTTVTVGLTKESWPAFRDKICEEVGLNPKDFQLSC